MREGGESKNENLGPCNELFEIIRMEGHQSQTPPEEYGKVKWMATSERVNLFLLKLELAET